MTHVNAAVGGVAVACLTPHWDQSPRQVTGLITNVDSECHIQWGRIPEKAQVEHLHCSFLYRAQVADYNLALSQVAHREETLFSWQLHQKGYQLWVVPGAVTWHLKSESGGIRSESVAHQYAQDLLIFRNFPLKLTIILLVLNGRVYSNLIVVIRLLWRKLRDMSTTTKYAFVVDSRVS